MPLDGDGRFIPIEQLQGLLEQYGVAGVSVAVLGVDGIATQTGGLSCKQESRTSSSVRRMDDVAMYDSTWLQIASLSKTLGTAYAVEYFKKKGIGMDSAVNPLLRAAGSGFTLRSAPGKPGEWAEQVTLAQLVNHSGLGMHYVNGVPMSEPMPPMVALMSGSEAAPAPYGYACLDLIKEPGTKFGYSGGGFLVLQHLLEAREGRPIAELMDTFLSAAGTTAFLGISFNTRKVAGKQYAEGFGDDGEHIAPLQFPPLAAGASGNPAALLDFLRQLAVAYRRPEGCGPIAHDTAVAMLTPGPDLGSEAFMRARVGLGVFIFEAKAPGAAKASKWMLHQASNNGFRGIYLVCFDGPDAEDGPRGFVVLSNGDNNAMLLNCAVVRLLLQSTAAFQPPLTGLDWSRAPPMDTFNMDGMKQEEIVNLGYQELVLNAFLR